MRVSQPRSLVVLLVRMKTRQGGGGRPTHHVNSIPSRSGDTEDLDTISEVPEDDGSILVSSL